MKTQVAIKLLCISYLLFICTSCKKYSKELTTVNFHLYNPVTNEGYANVKVQITQQEDVTGAFQVESKYENKVIWEGYTDANGKASYSFNAMKKDKFEYWQSVDNAIKLNKEIIYQPDFSPIKKNETNSIKYALVNYVNYISWYKNISCFDSNDRCKIRRKSIVKDWESWSEWFPTAQSPYPTGYEGCYESLSNLLSHTQDIWDIEMEVTKNGITTILRDTFYITGQNGTDTLKLFY